MLLPKKLKHRKTHRLRGKRAGMSKNGNTIAFGRFGIKAMGQAEITSRQIESARRAIARAIKRGGKVWIRIFPQKPITRKGAEVPMGSGKGALDHYAIDIKPGRILFEMDGVEETIARAALKLAIYKLPIKCKVVDRDAIN
ncbi:50S ribosomal protein L16 [Candidatus Peregrinibacteria bacterium CG11_big_fil_rev_8_21_14_0_20_41_10]|nr:MAG: 50S ribosomal protein L16 [Candidatus Peregrinibacteria bacterium CG11_big_fil_rev_8_21_14_0_20_41_10]PIZ76765.1 MAG: 50S ribosomal protein L16 [Candidatus Peregrinibacteria bacterium CG_4_10_14_0_2_um_filter_41_8]PJC37968.1 MAG: 50S ribosomal protein L16 [Candidatus Peregrinibacteria bacterium CG_4_9_14_0_2_um_filter_41_14]